LGAWRRVVGCLLIGLPYLVASYLIQGAFKETMEALFVLAFAIGLHELEHGVVLRPARRRVLGAVPLAVLAIGCVYAYSFPGLLWLGGAAALWGAVELVLVARRDSPRAAAAVARRAAPVAGMAIAVLVVAAAPEVGRMADFASFETFNPPGAGLGNLFNPISPLEALGIWPSGDFRLDPGDGAVPAIGYYLGELLGIAALAYGLCWWLRRSQRAVPAALTVAAALFAYAHFTGTPYQAAKATVIASPLAMLIAVRALVTPQTIVHLNAVKAAVAHTRLGVTGFFLRHEALGGAALALAFCAAASACTVLALVNGPVGPAIYSPALTELRPELQHGSTLVLAQQDLLADEHGRDYVVWELRGSRVCVAPEQPRNNITADNGYLPRPPAGIAHVITGAQRTPPFIDFRLERRSGPYVLWKRKPPPSGNGPCDLIAVGQRANPASD
jgi:hypothetical protein